MSELFEIFVVRIELCLPILVPIHQFHSQNILLRIDVVATLIMYCSTSQ